MFNSICVHYCDDIGKICEALLFYKKVNILFNERTLINLFNRVNPNEFIPFIYEHKKNISLHYYESGVATTTMSSMSPREFMIDLKLESDVDKSPYTRYLREHRVLPGQKGTNEDKKITDMFIKMLVHNYHDSAYYNTVLDDINTGQSFNGYCGNILTQKGLISNPQLSDFTIENIEDNRYKINSVNNILNENHYGEVRELIHNYVDHLMRIYEASIFSSDIYNLHMSDYIINTKSYYITLLI